MYYGGDEAEEGEVYDGSDQDDGDSDTNPNSDGSPRHSKFSHGSVPPGPRLLAKSGFISNTAKPDSQFRRFPAPHGSGLGPFQPFQSQDYQPLMRSVASETEVRGFETLPNNAYDKHPQVNHHEPHPGEHLASYEHHPPELPPLPNGPPAFPPMELPLPGLPAVPPTAVGSQEEIDRMHMMYQKACEFYERAAAKVSSMGLNIPLAVPPKPPPVSVLVPQPNPVNPSPPVPKPVNAVPPQYAAVPSSDLHPPPIPKVSVPHLPPQAVQPDAPPPQAPALSAEASTYSLAYAAAYKQTVSTIPAPENGGPAPTTPEYAAMWQRYMDYYLRYYMQAYASLMPNGSTKQGIVVGLPETTALVDTVPNKIPVSSANDESKGISLKTSEAIENRPDETIPTAKRPKLSEDEKDERNRVKKVDEKGNLSAVEKFDSQPVEATKQVSETAPTGGDDIKSSKCIWISNLPQGVKAVDVKERCTPFGRVQTIKIIGSRKSTPPSIYAYLVMESVEAAARLIEGLQGAKFDNQEIKVKRINALPIP